MPSNRFVFAANGSYWQQSLSAGLDQFSIMHKKKKELVVACLKFQT
jgi:hypothetical protein